MNDANETNWKRKIILIMHFCKFQFNSYRNLYRTYWQDQCSLERNGMYSLHVFLEHDVASTKKGVFIFS